MALFRTDYSGRGELSERQQKVFLATPCSGLVQPSDVLKARSGTNHQMQPQLHEY